MARQGLQRSTDIDSTRAVVVGRVRHEFESKRGYPAWVAAVRGAGELLAAVEAAGLLRRPLGTSNTPNRGRRDLRQLAEAMISLSEKLAQRNFDPHAPVEEIAEELEKERIAVRSLDEAPGSAKRDLDYAAIILIAHVATGILAAACGGVSHAVAKTFRSRDVAEATKHPWVQLPGEDDKGPLLSMGLQLRLNCGAWLLCPPVPMTPQSAAHIDAIKAAHERIRNDLKQNRVARDEVAKRLDQYEQIALSQRTGREMPNQPRHLGGPPHQILRTNADVIGELLALPAWILGLCGLLPLFNDTPVTGMWLVDPEGALPEPNAHAAPLASFDIAAVDAAGAAGFGVPLLDLHMNSQRRAVGVNDYPHSLTTLDGRPVAELAELSASAIERHSGWSVHVLNESLDAAVAVAVGPARLNPHDAVRRSRRDRTVALRLGARGAIGTLEGRNPLPGWLGPDHDPRQLNTVLRGVAQDVATWSDTARDPLHAYRVVTGVMNPSGKRITPGETQSACASLAVNLRVALDHLHVDPPDWTIARKPSAPNPN